jgi:vacuolar-type H+-ATPase subunit I/STV1
MSDIIDFSKEEDLEALHPSSEQDAFVISSKDKEKEEPKADAESEKPLEQPEQQEEPIEDKKEPELEEQHEDKKDERALRQLKKLKKDKQDLMARIQELEEHNQKLSDGFKRADTAAMEHYEKSVKLQLEEAKRLQASAIEEGDAQKQAEAMELIAKAAADARAIENYKRQQPEKVEKEEKQQPNNQNSQPYNPDISNWISQNSWFNENSDEYDAEMAEEVKAYDLVLSRQYQRMGKADKIATKDYFKDIDRYVREKFYMEKPDVIEPPIERKPFTKVSPVTNRPTTRHISDIRLSDAQKEIAQNLGMSEDDFKKAVANRISKNRGTR